MDNLNKTEIGSPEWIDQQRNVCEAAPAGKWELSSAGYVFSEDAPLSPFAAILGSGYKAVDTGNFIVAAHNNYPAALDVLEASMQREAEKDATIARMTAELAAEKKRADAAGQELERMRKWFSDNAAMIAAHRIGGCHFADDGLGAENTDAPTGAESE